MRKLEKGTKHKAAKIINIALSALILLFVCFFVIKLFFVTSVTVHQTSMYPTYSEGDKVYVNRLGRVERGAVAVYFDGDVSVKRLASSFSFFQNKDVKLLVKRIVALEGDMIWLEDADNGYQLKIQCADSGDIVSEEYVGGNAEKIVLAPITLNPDTAGVLYDATKWDPYIVGEGCAFMIGDNRPESQDSRVFGDVPLSCIIGTAFN